MSDYQAATPEGMDDQRKICLAERHGVKDAEVIQVIRVTASRGAGDYPSPLRCVVSYWLPDGTKLVEQDPQNA